MLNTSVRTLNILAALVWYIGGVVLLLKGNSLLLEADALRPQQIWPWLGAIGGVLFGGLKAIFLFNKSCQKNLARITALEQPRMLQFYRPGFFLILAAAVTFGATLSRLAHNNYPFLIGVAVLDLSIAVALLGSSYVFWQEKAFAK